MKNKIIDLTGQWQFKQYPLTARRIRDISADDWLECDVPSSIFTNLINAGQIERSDILANPENYRWVSKKPWLYKKTFDCPAEILKLNRIDIIFDGLDTIAQIWLNGKLIAKTNNMFIPHRFEVTRLLKNKNNHLMVKFDSATEYGNRLMNRYGQIHKDVCSDSCRVYLRKAQCQFGWDWAPSLPGCGIFRSVRIEEYKQERESKTSISAPLIVPKILPTSEYRYNSTRPPAVIISVK